MENVPLFSKNSASRVTNGHFIIRNDFLTQILKKIQKVDMNLPDICKMFGCLPKPQSCQLTPLMKPKIANCYKD